jgi:hypothetical protein
VIYNPFCAIKPRFRARKLDDRLMCESCPLYELDELIGIGASDDEGAWIEGWGVNTLAVDRVLEAVLVASRTEEVINWSSWACWFYLFSFLLKKFNETTIQGGNGGFSGFRIQWKSRNPKKSGNPKSGVSLLLPSIIQIPVKVQGSHRLVWCTYVFLDCLVD